MIIPALYPHPHLPQRVDDLVLAVADVPLSVPFVSLAQAGVIYGAWALTFIIIGESHTVQIRHEGAVVLQEMLACVQVDGQAVTHRHVFADLTAHTYTQAGYTIQVALDRPTWRLPTQPDGRLEYAFPRTFDRIPVTRIEWQRAGALVRWWTLHTYPEAVGVREVFTVSTLMVGDADVA